MYQKHTLLCQYSFFFIDAYLLVDLFGTFDQSENRVFFLFNEAMINARDTDWN